MNFINTLIYIAGREIRTVRMIYHKLSKGKYLWGIQLSLYDTWSPWRPGVKSIGDIQEEKSEDQLQNSYKWVDKVWNDF